VNTTRSKVRPAAEAYLDFLLTARKRAHETEMLNIAGANRIAKRLFAIARELKSTDEGRDELRRLMEFSDPDVRAEAAATSLEFDEPRALAVLHECRASNSSYASSVAMFHIAYWRTEHGLPMFEEASEKKDP